MAKNILMSAETLDSKNYSGIQYYLQSILNNLPDEYQNQITLLQPFSSSLNYKYIKKQYKTIFLNNVQSYQLWYGLGGKYLQQYSFDTYIGSVFQIPDSLPKNVHKISIFYDTIPLKDEFLTSFLGDAPPYKNDAMTQNLVLSKQYYDKALRTADTIITISNTVKNELVKDYNINEDKIKIVYPNIDNTFFKPSETREVLNKYGIHDPYFFMLNTTDGYYKRAKYILSAFKRSLSNTKVILVMAGTASSEIVNHFNSQLVGRFKYLGYVDTEDLPALYSGALAYVSAVYHGGFDLPPAEALSCGTPVFVHNSPLHKEILGNDQEYFNFDDYHYVDLSALFTKYSLISKKTINSESIKKFSIKNTIEQFISTIFND